MAGFPGWLAPLILGAHSPAVEQTISDILDPLSSAECNIHLIMFILDSMLITLIPEMGTATDASMLDGPVASLGGTTQPSPARRDPSRGSSIAGESGDNESEKGKNPSPSQSSGTYVHV